MQTDKGIVLASAFIEHLRRQSVILPALNAVERASAEAITRANRRIYDALAEPLSDMHRRRLDDLLKRRDNGKTTWLAWPLSLRELLGPGVVLVGLHKTTETTLS